MIYSSIVRTALGHNSSIIIEYTHISQTPTVYLTSTLDSSSSQIPIRFADPPPNGSRTTWGFHEESFGIWSCRFSADGNEVVAGGSGKIFVYDLLANRRTVKISAHEDDVNSCCWADTASGNVLVSASDDSFIKIWLIFSPTTSSSQYISCLRTQGSSLPRLIPEAFGSARRAYGRNHKRRC